MVCLATRGAARGKRFVPCGFFCRARKNFSGSANRFGAAEPLWPKMETIWKGPDMLYVKNLPAWERWGRGLIGLGLVAFGVATQWGRVAGWALVATGAVTLLTGFIGFCPMCAMVGRKPHTGS
jgi:hypothetical protein